jgi:5-methylcytosine-specific restriction enzyme subunit McrC
MAPSERYPVIIDLAEGHPHFIARDALAESLASDIFRSRCIEVEFPSPANSFRYRLLASTTVGYIPFGSGLLIRIQPKVGIHNIFRMLEVAYRLKSFQWRDGLVDVSDLADIFERLASILARRVLDRGRKGLHRSYVETRDDLQLIRGRVDTRETSLSLLKGVLAVRCEFEEHTSDIDDNRILLYTLSLLSRMSMRRIDVRKEVNGARRLLQGAASLRVVGASECVHRVYNRLNEDYRPLHALCRFFLHHTGPALSSGKKSLIPFTVEMPGLFELFVSEWLKTKVPPNILVRSQHKAVLDSAGSLFFRVDIALFDRSSDRCIAVLDTKYKSAEIPSESDIQQIVAYAVKMGASNGYLIYPSSTTRKIDLQVGTVRVRSIVFALSGDLDMAGDIFITSLFGVADLLTAPTGFMSAG